MFASLTPSEWETLIQHALIGLTNGTLIALIALGYTMVYGISELVNFAHGDLVMLGSFLALTLVGALGLSGAGPIMLMLGIALILLAAATFCATLNVVVDRYVYKPLRGSPRLVPLVSAIGVSFIFMNVGLFWGGATDRNFPDLVPNQNLLGDSAVRFSLKDLLVFVVTLPLMAGLTVFVKYSRMGKAMRATAQDPVAAQLMGIPVDRVIAVTFAVGGGLAGAASVIYALYLNTIGFQMGFQIGLFAFTAAVLGGIGHIPGAVLGGLVLGLVRAFGSAYLGEKWTAAFIFVMLIAILVFRPAGLLGATRKEKV
jgi:branched-chain amino acid transport system permease protein